MAKTRAGPPRPLAAVPEPTTLEQLRAAIERLHVDQLQMLALLQHLVGRPWGCGICGVPADLHNTNPTAGHLFMSQR